MKSISHFLFMNQSINQVYLERLTRRLKVIVNCDHVLMKHELLYYFLQFLPET